MTYDVQARKIAEAIREGAARDAERRGTGRYRATVTATSPLRLDVHGLDLELDASDVTLSRAALDSSLAVDDVVVLIEVDNDDDSLQPEWTVVGVEATDDEEPAPPPPPGPFVGQIAMSALVDVEVDWLECDGSPVTAEHATLRNKLIDAGSPYGSSGANPRLPDLQGRLPLGVSESHTLGSADGEENHTLTAAEMPSHNHGGATGTGTSGTDSPDHSHGGANVGLLSVAAGSWQALSLEAGGSAWNSSLASQRHAHSVPALSISSQGGGLEHNNMPPYLPVKFVIYAGTDA